MTTNGLRTTPLPSDTAPTWFVDSDSPEVASFVERALADSAVDRDDSRAVAVALFNAVRDSIRYDPYAASVEPEYFRASTVAGSESNWCAPKAILYTATLRHVGIPARLAFADVRNHLTSEKLTEAMGTDLFAWHGFTELYLNGRWFKASTAFNIEMCERFGVEALAFDGTAAQRDGATAGERLEHDPLLELAEAVLAPLGEDRGNRPTRLRFDQRVGVGDLEIEKAAGAERRGRLPGPHEADEGDRWSTR